jgi:hypothetical protein
MNVSIAIHPCTLVEFSRIHRHELLIEFGSINIYLVINNLLLYRSH